MERKYVAVLFVVSLVLTASVSTVVSLYVSQKNAVEHPEMSDGQFVNYLYSTVLHRDTYKDEVGYTYWLGELSSHNQSRTDVYMGFINSPEFLNQNGFAP